MLKQANGVVRPATLDNALDAGCGTLPTVVIVSACHSGVFLTPAMRQPNRVVLTAAAADRVSFGCGAGDRFTYYDQCLLQQFDGASTWGQLAQATRTCVQNLEKSMGIRTPSLPQIFVGLAVADLQDSGPLSVLPEKRIAPLTADHGGEVARHLVWAVARELQRVAGRA